MSLNFTVYKVASGSLPIKGHIDWLKTWAANPRNDPQVSGQRNIKQPNFLRKLRGKCYVFIRSEKKRLLNGSNELFLRSALKTRDAVLCASACVSTCPFSRRLKGLKDLHAFHSTPAFISR